MTLPDARARVERLRDNLGDPDSAWFHEANHAALSRVLAELDRLPQLREALDLLAKAGRDESLPDGALRHVVLMIADPSPITEADVARGQELAEKYGWK